VTNETDGFLTPTEAAGRLRVSKMTVYRLIHGGHLPAVQIGKAFRIRAADLESYLEAATVRIDPR
jgi:excisionase family DNA binding protein